jgi:hypothetical protein
VTVLTHSPEEIVSSATADAGRAFARALAALGLSGDEEGFDADELGRRGALLATSDLVWRERLGRLLTRDEVQEILGLQTRQAVFDLAKRGRLLALPTQSGRAHYPAFQFDLERGRTYPALTKALMLFREAEVNPYSAASWFCEPQSLLGERTPAQWMLERRSDETLIETARRSAAPLAR